jgi:hypothetical protein
MNLESPAKAFHRNNPETFLSPGMGCEPQPRQDDAMLDH